MVPFSAPGLRGRMSDPATRWTKMNPAPTARNSRTKAAREVITWNPSARFGARRSLYHQSLRRGRGGGRLRRRRRIGRLDPDRLGDQLRPGDGRRVERCLAPGDLQRQLGEIDDAAVAAEAALVVGR